MDLQPRLGRVEDVPEAVRLAAQMYASIGMAITDEWSREAEEAARSRIGHDVVLMVVDDPGEPGRLAAVAAVALHTRLPAPFLPSGRYGYVQWVCTDVPWRGRGLARTVMTALLDWMREDGVGIAELHATEMAEGLYRSFGFIATERPTLRLTLRRGD